MLPNIFHVFVDATFVYTRAMTSEVAFVDAAAEHGVELSLEQVQDARQASETNDFDVTDGIHIISFLEV